MRRKVRQGSQVKTTVPETIPYAEQYSAATLTFHSDIDGVVGAYHYLVPAGVGNKAR